MAKATAKWVVRSVMPCSSSPRWNGAKLNQEKWRGTATGGRRRLAVGQWEVGRAKEVGGREASEGLGAPMPPAACGIRTFCSRRYLPWSTNWSRCGSTFRRRNTGRSCSTSCRPNSTLCTSRARGCGSRNPRQTEPPPRATHRIRL